MRYDGPGFYGLNPPSWVSGAAQQPAGQWVTSPADKEIYQRIAATNSSTTDPADDVTNYKAESYTRTRAMTPRSRGDAGSSSNYLVRYPRTTLAAISLGVRTSVLSLTGRGTLNVLGYCKASNSAANTDIRFELFIDGRSVLDTTPTFNSGVTTQTLNIVGWPLPVTIGSNWPEYSVVPEPIEFKRSAELFMTPSIALPASTILIPSYRSEG